MPSIQAKADHLSSAPAAGAGVRPNLVVAICCMSLLLVSMDVTIVNVALPAIQRDLHATLSGLQWIIDAYTLVLASLLMLSGSMSDRFGRRRVFMIGITLFTTGSLLCSLASGIAQLVAFRAMQGLGASMLNPVALSIIVNVFTVPKGRARAIGVWGAVSGISLALGPLLGGVLTQTVGWRSIFWINVPIGVAALCLAFRFVPESRSPHPRAFDPLGQLLVFAALTTLVYAVIEGPRAGWTSPAILLTIAVFALALVCFLLYEPRRQDPLLDLRFFGSVPFSSAAILALCSFYSFAALLFLNALYLQQVRGLSALQSGLCTLPFAIMIMLSSPLSGRLVGARGTRPSLFLAGTGLLVGTLILTQLSTVTPLPLLLAAYALFGLGIGMINPAITNSAVTGMPLAQAGVAAAIASTSRQIGAALGVAVAGTVVTARHSSLVNFAAATHPIWWSMCACAVLVLLAGWASNTAWAKRSTEGVESLFSSSGLTGSK